MCRSAVATVLALALGLSPLAAQQANSAGATLTINQTNPSGPGPFSVNIAGGGAFVINVQGPALSPFAILWGITQTGAVPLGPPAGTFDLAFPSPPPQFLVNGIAPTSILDLLANLDGTGTWEFTGAIGSSPPLSTFGMQAIVADFTIAFPFFVLSAATDITVGGFSSNTVTFNEPGDDTTVAYFHQVTSFPFYANSYGRTHVDTNGYVTLGSDPIDSQWNTNATDFLNGPPRIAPYWSDMHMSSVVASAFGTMSVAPASIVITETAGTGGAPSTISYEWRNSTEAAGTSLQWDYRATIDSAGTIVFDYGPALGMGAQIPASGNIFALVGISPGGGLSMNTMSQDLVSACPAGGTGVNACSPFVAANMNDAIFETFDPTAGPFPLDFQTFAINFSPAPGFTTIYQMQ